MNKDRKDKDEIRPDYEQMIRARNQANRFAKTAGNPDYRYAARLCEGDDANHKGSKESDRIRARRLSLYACRCCLRSCCQFLRNAGDNAGFILSFSASRT